MDTLSEFSRIFGSMKVCHVTCNQSKICWLITKLMLDLIGHTYPTVDRACEEFPVGISFE